MMLLIINQNYIVIIMENIKKIIIIYIGIWHKLTISIFNHGLIQFLIFIWFLKIPSRPCLRIVFGSNVLG